MQLQCILKKVQVRHGKAIISNSLVAVEVWGRRPHHLAHVQANENLFPEQQNQDVFPSTKKRTLQHPNVKNHSSMNSPRLE